MTTEYLSMQEVKAAELRLLRIFDCYCREEQSAIFNGFRHSSRCG